MAEGNSLSWQHAWPEAGPDFILVRARDPSVDPEPEIVGRIMLHRPVGASADYWMWTLTSRAGAIGIEKPAFDMAGSLPTQREAREALVSAWRKEEAFRREAQNQGIRKIGLVKRPSPIPSNRKIGLIDPSDRS